MKPIDWPRYLIAKRLKSGEGAYYWNARKSDIDGGFTLHREALGTDYGAARARAQQLNAHLDAWRMGRGVDRSLDSQGTEASIGGSRPIAGPLLS